jgi:hypothetical protein
MLKQLWNDDAGYIISTEMLLIFVILVLGLIAGLGNLRMAIVNELTESAQALLALNQGYTISGLSGCSGTSAGSSASDSNGFAILSSLNNGQVQIINSSLCP